jgi:hypothetical protein
MGHLLDLRHDRQVRLSAAEQVAPSEQLRLEHVTCPSNEIAEIRRELQSLAERKR